MKFVKVAKPSISDFIRAARYRILFIKPAFYRWEIEELLSSIQKNNINKCELYFEKGDESIRFGLGDTEALNLIIKTKDKFNVQTVNRIKLSILIVDNNCLIYSPNIAQLDDESHLDFPSGFYGDESLVKKILLELPGNEVDISTDIKEINNPFEEIRNFQPQCEQLVNEQLSNTLSKLENYPPIDPKKLKKINLYRNNFKILKRQLLGIKIKNRKLNINSFIKLLESKNERLLSSWNIFSNEDINKFQNMYHFAKELQLIDNEFIIDIGRFGSLIKTQQIKDYEERINKLKDEFIDFMKDKCESENRFFKYIDNQNEHNYTLNQVLNNSRNELIYYLESISIDDKTFLNRLLEEDRFLKRELEEERITLREVYNNYIKSFVDNRLKFPNKDEMLGKIDIKFDLYDISDELLNNNDDFKKILEGIDLVELRNYEEGYQLVKE
jgi:hypothetical protein